VIDSLKTDNEEFKAVVIEVLNAYGCVTNSAPILNTEDFVPCWTSEGQGSSPFLPPAGPLGSFLSPEAMGQGPPPSANTSLNNVTNTMTNVTNNSTTQLLQQLQSHSVVLTTELSDIKKKYISQSESHEMLKSSQIVLEASREVGKKCKKSLKKIFRKISNFLELNAKDLDSEEMFIPRTQGIERTIMSSPRTPLSDNGVGGETVSENEVMSAALISEAEMKVFDICIYICAYMHVCIYI
jgi:hypothetical protein